MSGEFDSAWLKWARAVVHADALHRDLTAFTSQPGGRTLTVGIRPYDPKRHGFPVDIAAVPAWPVTWGVMLGDVVANFRSALEHCAWTVVHRGEGGGGGFPLNKREARDIGFPIALRETDFNSQLPVKLLGAEPADIAIIRKAQPYRLGARSHGHVLAILRDLTDRDKHRVIQPVRMIPKGAQYQFRRMQDCIPSPDSRRPRPRRIALEPGAELGVIRVRKTGPDPKIDVDAQFQVGIGATDRFPLAAWLQGTSRIVSTVLGLFADPPDEIVQLGDPALFFSGS